MRKVVSNTTPIISLLKISKLSLLQELYGEIYIPHAVFKEIEAGKEKVFYKDLSKIDWIKIIDIEDKNALKYFLDIDAGEAEAIILATELNADLILMDEKLGRFYANNANLTISGTVGILIRAKNLGFISAIKPLLIKLRQREVWINDKLMNEALELAGE